MTSYTLPCITSQHESEDLCLATSEPLNISTAGEVRGAVLVLVEDASALGSRFVWVNSTCERREFEEAGKFRLYSHPRTKETEAICE